MSDLFIRPELRTPPVAKSNPPAAPPATDQSDHAPKGDEVQKSGEKGQEKVFNESQPKCKDPDKNPCEKDCNEKTSEKDPNEKTSEKDPNEKASEKDPNEKSSEKDSNEKGAEKDPNEKSVEKDPNEKGTEKAPEGPPPQGSASITGDPHVSLDMNRDGFLTRNERVFDLHVEGQAEDALVYGGTHVDVTTEKYDNGHPYTRQVDLGFEGGAGVSVQVTDQNQMQVTEMVDGKPVNHPVEPGTTIVLANGVTMTAEEAINRAGLPQNSLVFTEADGTTTTVIQNPHQITGASLDNLDVVVDTDREITAGRNTITGVGAPNDTYTAEARFFAA